METLAINIKNKKDSKLIKESLTRPNVEVKVDKALLRKQIPKHKIESPEELYAMGGILKGQVISKEHLRSLSWKKRI